MSQIENITWLLDTFIKNDFCLLLNQVHRCCQHIGIQIALYSKFATQSLAAFCDGNSPVQTDHIGLQIRQSRKQFTGGHTREIDFRYIQIR
ncbi:hypothetical protein D3C76_1383060 [compost metagenome]